MIVTIFFIWIAHATIAALLSIPAIMLGRERVHWRPWELLVFLLPFVVWLALMLTPLAERRKSVSNLVEPLFFSLVIPGVALLRAALAKRFPERALAGCLLGVACLVAVASFFVVPSLPD